MRWSKTALRIFAATLLAACMTVRGTTEEPRGWLVIEGGSYPFSPVVAQQFRDLIGGADAKVISANIVAGSPGVYQINLQVPADAANGDLVRGGGVATLEGVQPGRHAGEPGALRAHAPLHVLALALEQPAH